MELVVLHAALIVITSWPVAELTDIGVYAVVSQVVASSELGSWSPDYSYLPVVALRAAIGLAIGAVLAHFRQGDMRAAGG